MNPAPLAGVVEATVEREGRRILGPITFQLMPGERVALFGPNGAGKTTLLRVLAGLQPAAGSVKRVPVGSGYAPQAVAEHLFPWFSVLRNAALPLRVSQRADADAVASRLLGRLLPGIDPRRRAGRLSGGEQQALSLARALCAPGPAVLADEPFSALSRSARENAMAVLKSELGERALVLVTHDPAEVEALCTRVVRLEPPA